MTGPHGQVMTTATEKVQATVSPYPARRPVRSLKSLAIQGSMWTLGGYGASSLLRLGSNLVLTRLLFPEAFGLLAIVAVVSYGLEMFSDVGIGPAVIRDERGDDPSFLNTAWTMQVVRGFILWMGACLLAWPMASFYGEPQLAQLIPVVAIGAIIAGFNSTALYSCTRHMELGKLTLLELATQIISFIAVVSWALIYPTIWALVGGILISRTVHMALSHAVLRGIRNRIKWERIAAATIFRFGRWIFLSSALYFLASQADRLLLGHFLGMALLGVYSIGLLLSEVIRKLGDRVIRRVFFPACSRIVRENRDRLRESFYRARLAIDLLFLLPTGVLMVIGGWVVEMLYDERYAEAGWILQLLCLRVAMSCTLAVAESCLVVLGQTQYAFLQNVGRTAWILIGIPLGWWLSGLSGVVWAVALSEIVVLVVLWRGLSRHGVLSFSGELRSVLIVGVGALLGFGLLHVLPT